jgi:hypothetical protein
MSKLRIEDVPVKSFPRDRLGQPVPDNYTTVELASLYLWRTVLFAKDARSARAMGWMDCAATKREIASRAMRDLEDLLEYGRLFS